MGLDDSFSSGIFDLTVDEIDNVAAGLPFLAYVAISLAVHLASEYLHHH